MTKYSISKTKGKQLSVVALRVEKKVNSRIEKTTVNQLQLAVAINRLDNILSLQLYFQPSHPFLFVLREATQNIRFQDFEEGYYSSILKKAPVLCRMRACSLAEKF